MTIRIPRVFVVLAGLALAVGGGVALGYWLADESTPKAITSSTTASVTVTDTTTDTTTRTTETTPIEAFEGLPGGQVIQDLIEEGSIRDATPVEPEEGWESEFELSRGDVIVRFRDDPDRRVVEWTYLQTAAGLELDSALQRITEARGFELIDE